MISLGGPKNQSTHGRALLIELRDRRSARVEIILDYLRKDPLSGRLKEATSGNNAYHLLFLGNFPLEFENTVFDALMSVCPEGARIANSGGSTPLHMALSAGRLNSYAIKKLISSYPTGAGVVDNQGLIPLFLCCMREDASAEICKELCKVFPTGPSTQNKTHSFPLHFAAKRSRPNLDILRILIRRNPAAASAVNGFGLVPLHCISALSANTAAVEMIYNANPDAIKLRDRQGRTCLHLAVLHVGREHLNAVQLEEDEARLLQQQEQQRRDDEDAQTGGAKGGDTDSDYSGDEEGAGCSGRAGRGQQLREMAGTDRAVIRFLIRAYPQALCMENNFQATPVETVLEKMRSQRTKNKVVAVYGLYDDPFTARLLLLAQHYRSRAYTQGRVLSDVALPSLRPRHLAALRDLNWTARKDALCVALLAEPRYCEVVRASEGKGAASEGGPLHYRLRVDKTQSNGCSTGEGGSANAGAKSAGAAGGRSRPVRGKGGARPGKAAASSKGSGSGGGVDTLTTVFGQMAVSSEGADLQTSALFRGNMLARLQGGGLQDVVRNVFSYI